MLTCYGIKNYLILKMEEALKLKIMRTYKAAIEFFRRLWSIIPNVKRLLGNKAFIALILAIVAGLGQGFVEMGMTAFLQVFLREANLLQSSIQLPRILQNWHPSIFALAMTLIIIGVVRSGNQFLMNHGSSVANERISSRFRLLLLHRVLYTDHGSVIPASKSHYLISAIFPVASAVFAHIANAIPNAVMVFVLFVAMFKVAPGETCFGIFGIGILGLVVNTINRNIATIAKQSPVEHSELIKSIERVARNWLLVKILRTESDELTRMVGSVLRQEKIYLRTTFWIQFSSVLPSSFGIVLVSAIIAISMSFFHTPGIALVSFLYLFLRFVQVFSGVVTSMAHAYGGKQQFLEAWRFFFENKAVKSDELVHSIVESYSSKQLISKKYIQNQMDGLTDDRIQLNENVPPPDLIVDNLSYKYSDLLPLALNIQSLQLKGGSQLGIVGPSGSGKSTFLLLVLGILKPTFGTIKIGGQKPEDYFTTSKRVGYVGAEPFLISGDIKSNITYGLSRKVSDAEIWEALKKASLMEFVESRPNGLAYEIKEDGSGLSAGQKQRIALARAFLANPEILILDESTANLDSETEMEIVNAVSQLKGTVTTIIVSHRDAALKYVDQKIILN